MICRLQNDSAVALCDLLDVNNSITELILDHNLFQDISFGPTLCRNATLQKLSLSYNNLNFESVCEILDSLSTNRELRYLGLKGIQFEGSAPIKENSSGHLSKSEVLILKLAYVMRYSLLMYIGIDLDVSATVQLQELENTLIKHNRSLIRIHSDNIDWSNPKLPAPLLGISRALRANQWLIQNEGVPYDRRSEPYGDLEEIIQAKKLRLSARTPTPPDSFIAAFGDISIDNLKKSTKRLRSDSPPVCDLVETSSPIKTSHIRVNTLSHVADSLDNEAETPQFMLNSSKRWQSRNKVRASDGNEKSEREEVARYRNSLNSMANKEPNSPQNKETLEQTTERRRGEELKEKPPRPLMREVSFSGGTSEEISKLFKMMESLTNTVQRMENEFSRNITAIDGKISQLSKEVKDLHNNIEIKSLSSETASLSSNLITPQFSSRRGSLKSNSSQPSVFSRIEERLAELEKSQRSESERTSKILVGLKKQLQETTARIKTVEESDRQPTAHSRSGSASTSMDHENPAYNKLLSSRINPNTEPLELHSFSHDLQRDELEVSRYLPGEAESIVLNALIERANRVPTPSKLKLNYDRNYRAISPLSASLSNLSNFTRDTSPARGAFYTSEKMPSSELQDSLRLRGFCIRENRPVLKYRDSREWVHNTVQF